MSGARGESTLNVGKREIKLLYTNRALADAEKELGKGIVGILQGFRDGGAGINEIAVLLKTGMEAARRDGQWGGKRVQTTDAYDVLDQVGFAGVTAKVMEAVAAVISYDGEKEEQEEAEDPN